MEDITYIELPDGTQYGINAGKVNGHTINANVPSGASFTDTNTTYKLSKSGSSITLTGSDGSTTSVADSDTNTILKTYTTTLSASKWTGTSAPYGYDIGATYGSKAIIQFNSDAGNTTQLDAAQSANIQGGSGTKIYAWGDKPTVDIPVVILYE